MEASVFSNRCDAPASAEEYKQAIRRLVGDRDSVAILRATPEELSAGLAGLSEENAVRPETDGKWSLAQLVQHFLAMEFVFGFRFRLVLGQGDAEVAGMDQDSWIAQLAYPGIGFLTAARWFRQVREVNLALIGGLDERGLRRAGRHRERGLESVAEMLTMSTGHDLVHLRQLQRIREALDV